MRRFVAPGKLHRRCQHPRILGGMERAATAAANVARVGAAVLAFQVAAEVAAHALRDDIAPADQRILHRVLSQASGDDRAAGAAAAAAGRAHTKASNAAHVGDGAGELLAAVDACRARMPALTPSELDECVHAARGFSAHEQPSAIAGGGAGLFARGTVPAGAVVTMYGGPLYSRWRPWDLRRVLQGNDYMYARRDGYLIDGRACSGHARAGASQLAGRWDADAVLAHVGAPHTLASLCNHPPRGQVPNCMLYPVSSPALLATPAATPRASPVAWPNTSAMGKGAARARGVIALVSLREIAAGEELLVDYHFDPRSPESHPEWYVQQDDHDDDIIDSPRHRHRSSSSSSSAPATAPPPENANNGGHDVGGS